MSLREKIIKLAHEKPELRQHLVPLLRKTAEKPLEEQEFKNPETGNMVKFKSLPAEEQKKIREKQKGKGDKKDPSKKDVSREVMRRIEDDVQTMDDQDFIDKGYITKAKLYPDGDDEVDTNALSDAHDAYIQDNWDTLVKKHRGDKKYPKKDVSREVMRRIEDDVQTMDERDFIDKGYITKAKLYPDGDDEVDFDALGKAWDAYIQDNWDTLMKKHMAKPKKITE